MWTLAPYPAERRAALAVLCALLLAGCQNPPPRKDNLDSARATLAEAQSAPAPVPAEVTRALVPKLELDAPKPLAPSNEQRFDISVNEVPARQFFMSLVDGTRYNLVVHPDVGGKIALSLKHANIPEVIAKRLFRWKPELDLKELRYLQSNEVDLYGIVAQAITMKPAKPSITVERVEG